MENFNELNLPETLQQALAKMEFNTPTPVQAQAIPVALEGNDILGSAQTGTGKTGAFGIPMVAHLINNPGSSALIMTPTRELAVQVNAMLKKLLANNTYIKTALLIGGEVMFRQFAQLEDNPRIIIGTPGRINDHLARRSLNLSKVDFLVLDETDRMLDMGFGVQIDKILTYMPGKRQTLLFSATLPSHIVRLAEKYMRDAVRIAVGSTTSPVTNIKQEIIKVPQAQKYETLTQQLDARTGSIIVFVRTKHGCDRIAAKLDRENHSAEAIHGDLRQNKRDKVIRMFREKKIRILVATDVAARGLDIPHIEHVINYDLPQCPEDYIHRIGRTARAGAMGEALCLVAPDENGKWAAIERLMNGGQGSSEEQGRGGHRSKGKSGYGRKNEGGFGARREGGYSNKSGRDGGGYKREGNSFGGKRDNGGYKQDSNRKPHRKGQSWQVAHDERKAQEAASAPRENMNAAVEQKFERKFEQRDEKASFRNEGRNDRPSKPWQKREGGADRPYQKREASSDRPYQKRERSEGGDKPWQKKREGGNDRPYQKREGASDRPYQKREGSSDRPYQKREGGADKPWQKKREGGSDRPYQKREGASDRPYQKREGSSDRPYQKREGGADKPWQKKREGASDRPYQKREGGADKPWQKKREGGSDRPYQKREGASDRPAFKRDGDKPRFTNGRKLSGQSISASKSRFDGDKPLRRRDRDVA